jgi:acyl-coenzyme A synthetase/AMP-(fatty) acid ligase
VKAFVSLRPGRSVTEEELIAFAKERMAAYKYPRAIEFLDEIPKTVTGKLLRRELRTRSSLHCRKATFTQPRCTKVALLPSQAAIPAEKPEP